MVIYYADDMPITLSFIRDTSEDALLLFFESRRRSGGGDIEDYIYSEDGDVIYITFESSESK